MSNTARISRAGTCLALLGCTLLLAGPLTAASASKKSIIGVIKGYNSKILTDEGHLETALAAYETSHESTELIAAIQAEITDLDGMRAAVKSQPAKTLRVKRAKAKIDKGIKLIAHADTNFQKTIESVANPAEAKADANKTVKDVKRGHKDLVAGLKLLAS